MCGSILSSSFIRSNVCSSSNIAARAQYLYWYGFTELLNSKITVFGMTVHHVPVS